MRTFGRFRFGDSLGYGEVRGNEVHLLTGPFWESQEFTGGVHSLGEAEVAVPVVPTKIIAVGLNYAEHIKEMKRDEIGSPLIWFKAPSSLVAHQNNIRIAFPEHQTHFETELAVIIGKSGINLTIENALDYVFGYTIGLDISDRDLQKAEKQFSRCKSFDTYTPLGPFVYSEIVPADLSISLEQNGVVRQNARTSQMIYSVPTIVSFASQALTLCAGDVILTGTPSGVGPIHEGDELVARIGDWPPLRVRVENRFANAK